MALREKGTHHRSLSTKNWTRGGGIIVRGRRSEQAGDCARREHPARQRNLSGFGPPHRPSLEHLQRHPAPKTKDKIALVHHVHLGALAACFFAAEASATQTSEEHHTVTTGTPHRPGTVHPGPAGEGGVQIHYEQPREARLAAKRARATRQNLVFSARLARSSARKRPARAETRARAQQKNLSNLAHIRYEAAEPGAGPRRAKAKDKIASARATPRARFSTFFAPFRRAARARPQHVQPVDRAARGRGSGLGRDGTAPGGRVAAEDGRRGRLRRAWHVLRSGNLCRRTTRRRGRPVVTLCRAVNGARRVEHGGTRGHNAQKDGHGRRGQCCAASVVI